MREHKFEVDKMGQFWNRRGKSVCTLINKASVKGRLKIVEYILSFEGISLTICDKRDLEFQLTKGYNPLQNACHFKNWDIVKAIMAYSYMSKEEKKKYVSLRGGYEILEKLGTKKTWEGSTQKIQ